MDDADDIPTPLDAMTDAMVGAGFVLGRIIGHMMHCSAVTGEHDPPVEDVLYDLLQGTIAPMVEHREFELGVAARVLSDALTLVMSEVLLVPVDELETPEREPRRPRKRRRR